MAFSTTLVPDAPIVLDANYQFNTSDRRYIDNQIIALESMIQQLVLSGLSAQWYSSNDTISTGQVVCTSLSGQVVRMFYSAAVAAGCALGIALLPSVPGQPVLVATGGTIPSTITGGVSGGAGWIAIVNTATAGISSVQYASNITSSTYVLGTITNGGTSLTLSPLPLGVGAPSAGGSNATSIQTVPVNTFVAADGGLLGYSSSNAEFDLLSISSTDISVGTTTGTTLPLTVVGIHGTSVPSAAGNFAGNGIYLTGPSTGGWSALNLAGGLNYVTGTLPATNVGGVSGVSVSGTPTSGYVLTATSGSAATWQAATGASVTWANDLAGSTSTTQTVAALTHGSTPIPVTGPGFQWLSTQTAPAITQASSSGTTGATLTIQAQNATGTSSTGGSLSFSTGSGTSSNGTFYFFPGGSGNSIAYNPTGIWNWSSGVTTPGLSQSSTTAANGANMTISSQASTATNGNQGNVVLNIPAKTGTGTEASFQFTRTGSAYPVAQIGLFPANAGVAGFWFPSIVGVQATSTNAAVFGDGTDMYINSPSASGFVAITQGNNTQTATFYPAKAVFAAPILGDSTQSSPYGVHGDVTTAITTSTTLSAAQYAMLIIPVAPTAAMTLTLPRAAAGSGYSKLFDVQAAFAVTITDGTHSVTLPAAIGTYEVAFTNAKLMGGTTKL